MSIAAAFSNAVSGLAAVSRGTEIVSANVANALTPGYARRELAIASSPVGGGVQVSGVTRSVNASVLADRRAAEASLGHADTLTRFWTGIEAQVGVPGEPDSLSAAVTALEASLAAAASRPDSDIRLQAAGASAAALAGRLNAATEAVADARTEAETAIAAAVAGLREGLSEVARLNRAVIVEQANGRDASALLDARQAAIDGIAAIVPLREVPRENGRIALFTAGGQVLLDGSEPADIRFTPAGRIQPGMAVGTPPVQRLVIDGTELSERQMILVAGGSLEAAFRVRDEVAPQVQARLDAMARDLYERFADPALDATLAPGDPGLFTERDGSAFDPLNERGFAGRISLAAAVDPAGGAEFWRLRDGLKAAAPGDVGNAALLTGLGRALQAPRTTGSAAMAAGSRSASTFAADLSTEVSTRRLAAEAARGRDLVRRDGLDGALLRDGVDTDREMERLLQLENAYAANAKVIAAADAMIAAILEL